MTTTEPTTEPGATTVSTLRPRAEGANIRTWIGFKHFMYLAEEAVLDWWRERGCGPHRLYHECGLGLAVVDSSVQLPSVLEVDDLVVAETSPAGPPGRFGVRMGVRRGDGRVGVLRGRLALAAFRQPEVDAPAPPPVLVAPLVAAGLPADGPSTADGRSGPSGVDGPGPPPGHGGFAYDWRVPYFHCQYSDRLAHSGYVRVLEDAVDRFLADRGLSVGRLLAERGWIPVVSRARVRMLADVHMEEVVHTVFRVTDILRGVTFDGRMDCYVRRGDRLVHTATGTILHGYARSRGPGAGRLVELDEATVAALTAVGPGGEAR
jgi:acyl-CoA thioesterase FadM